MTEPTEVAALLRDRAEPFSQGALLARDRGDAGDATMLEVIAEELLRVAAEVEHGSWVWEGGLLSCCCGYSGRDRAHGGRCRECRRPRELATADLCDACQGQR